MAENGSGAVLIVPAVEKDRGGGHLARSLFLLQALERGGRETCLWISEDNKENVFSRFQKFFEDFHARGFLARLLSREDELSGREWDFIVLDRFRTPAGEFAFWSALAGRCRGSVIGIDEGGPCRSRFDFLIDLLPSLERTGANLSAPFLLPMPRNRRPFAATPSNPLRVLISFGAEDSAGLGFLAARALSQASLQAASRQAAARQASLQATAEITLIAANWDYSDRKQKQLPGVTVTGTLLNLKEHLAEYDLFITHFGLGAFEAVYARVPVLLVSPTAYHEKLSRNAGFFSLGVGSKAARRLGNLRLHKESLKKLGSRGGNIARRFDLEGEQDDDLGSFFGGLAPYAPRNCPICGEEAQSGELPVLARFPEETYRRCPCCGMISLSRLNAPPIEYGTDYFFEFYKKQYGKTYLEDFPGLVETGRKRLVHIQALLGFPQEEDTPLHRPTLLDIGCAYGPFLAAAAEGGFSPFGVDPVEDAVRYINEELGFQAWHGFFPTKAKAEDGPFDAVTLWYVLEHFQEPGTILGYIHGILKEGGVLAFSTPSFSGISGRKRLRSFLKNSPPDHWTIWSPRSCRKVFRQYGFRLEKIVVTGHHPERFPLAGRLANPARKGLFYRLLLLVSRLFRLGDTFEAYGVKCC